MKRSEIPRDSGAVVGCYSVHLYCQHPNHEEDASAAFWRDQINPECRHGPGEFDGTTEADTLASARRSGWWISRHDEEYGRAVLCPYHARQVPR